MASRSLDPGSQGCQNIARGQPSPPPRPRRVHRPRLRLGLRRRQRRLGQRWTRRHNSCSSGTGWLASRSTPCVARKPGRELLAGVCAGLPTRWGRGSRGGGGADIHWNDERGAASGCRMGVAKLGGARSPVVRSQGPVTRCACHRWTSGGGGDSAHAGFVKVPPQSGCPPAVRTLTFIAPVTQCIM